MSETEYQENLHFIVSHPEAVAREMTKQKARIARLEKALRELLWYTNQLELVVYDPSEWPTEHDEVKKARAALEDK